MLSILLKSPPRAVIPFYLTWMLVIAMIVMSRCAKVLYFESIALFTTKSKFVLPAYKIGVISNIKAYVLRKDVFSARTWQMWKGIGSECDQVKELECAKSDKEKILICSYEHINRLIFKHLRGLIGRGNIPLCVTFKSERATGYEEKTFLLLKLSPYLRRPWKRSS